MPTVTNEELARLKKAEEKLKERYKKQNEHTNTIYDRLNFTVPAGKKAEIEAAAKAAGVSLNAFCRDAVLEEAEKVLKKSGQEEAAPPFL
ncbi:MAG TPA: DUF1778 domain-containing protein [Candidatus Acetatifactor stercoripullorum]|uniref:DUF1778 domain-containing protein n=1 Tax=Candidatus Acetatifactor stercoripullorum TaxID=2838414 RepID=A0A9D1R7D6_9FIRM|nr:DUF1778 domain-containing protein [Candidatus Acetatifactor stercoripullorum]